MGKLKSEESMRVDEETAEEGEIVETIPVTKKHSTTKHTTSSTHENHVSKPEHIHRSLWISGLTTSTKARNLKELFSAHGRVTASKVFGSTKGKESLGNFGFVTMATKIEATTCVEKFNQLVLHDKVIKVSIAENDPTLKKPKSRSNEKKPSETEKERSKSHDSSSNAVAEQCNGSSDAAGIKDGKSEQVIDRKRRLDNEKLKEDGDKRSSRGRSESWRDGDSGRDRHEHQSKDDEEKWAQLERERLERRKKREKELPGEMHQRPGPGGGFSGRNNDIQQELHRGGRGHNTFNGHGGRGRGRGSWGFGSNHGHFSNRGMDEGPFNRGDSCGGYENRNRGHRGHSYNNRGPGRGRDRWGNMNGNRFPNEEPYFKEECIPRRNQGRAPGSGPGGGPGPHFFNGAVGIAENPPGSHFQAPSSGSAHGISTQGPPLNGSPFNPTPLNRNQIVTQDPLNLTVQVPHAGGPPTATVGPPLNDNFNRTNPPPATFVNQHQPPPQYNNAVVAQGNLQNVSELPTHNKGQGWSAINSTGNINNDNISINNVQNNISARANTILDQSNNQPYLNPNNSHNSNVNFDSNQSNTLPSTNALMNINGNVVKNSGTILSTTNESGSSSGGSYNRGDTNVNPNAQQELLTKCEPDYSVLSSILANTMKNFNMPTALNTKGQNGIQQVPVPQQQQQQQPFSQQLQQQQLQQILPQPQQNQQHLLPQPQQQQFLPQPRQQHQQQQLFPQQPQQQPQLLPQQQHQQQPPPPPPQQQHLPQQQQQQQQQQQLFPQQRQQQQQQFMPQPQQQQPPPQQQINQHLPQSYSQHQQQQHVLQPMQQTYHQQQQQPSSNLDPIGEPTVMKINLLNPGPLLGSGQGALQGQIQQHQVSQQVL